MFEPRLGHDFSRIRIHAAPAAASAGAVIQRSPLDSTNYRFDTYGVTASDLSDPDIVARFKALSVRSLLVYRRRTTDAGVIEYIDQLLDQQLAAQTLDQLSAELQSETDPAARSYLSRWLESHVPTSYEADVGANQPGGTATAMTVSGIAITVLPDKYVDEVAFAALLAQLAAGKASDITRSITISDPKWQPHYVTAAGKVTAVRPTTQTLRIQTVYQRGTDRFGPSGYGVGTRKGDADTGRTTLAHHEGAHASCFLRYVKDHAPPIFAARRGDTTAQLKTKEADFGTAMSAYYADLNAQCGPSIDCVGNSASFCPSP